MAAPMHVQEWTGRDVTIAEIEERLSLLRQESEAEDDAPNLRTSVMTHMAWVPKDWLEAARKTLAGLAERHPSRTIILVPDPGAKRDAIDAEGSLGCFALGERHVGTEVVELRLRGGRAAAPASIAAAQEVRIAGPKPDALLLHGWLCSRLERELRFVYDDADVVELVAVDGQAVTPPRIEQPSASDLLSAELDAFGRDPIYEEACAAAAR